jgi:hypothetical protein
MRHYLIELGMGTDLHKPDPTRCALRAGVPWSAFSSAAC